MNFNWQPCEGVHGFSCRTGNPQLPSLFVRCRCGSWSAVVFLLGETKIFPTADEAKAYAEEQFLSWLLEEAVKG